MKRYKIKVEEHIVWKVCRKEARTCWRTAVLLRICTWSIFVSNCITTHWIATFLSMDSVNESPGVRSYAFLESCYNYPLETGLHKSLNLLLACDLMLFFHLQLETVSGAYPGGHPRSDATVTHEMHSGMHLRNLRIWQSWQFLDCRSGQCGLA